MKKTLLTLTTLALTVSVFASDPTGVRSKSAKSVKAKVTHQYKPALISLIPQGEGNSFLLQSQTTSSKPISFMVTNQKGIVVMWGENYNAGSTLNFNHFSEGEYTMYFDRDTNSAAARFVVSY